MCNNNVVLRYSIKNNNVQPELKISFPTAHYAKSLCKTLHNSIYVKVCVMKSLHYIF